MSGLYEDVAELAEAVRELRRELLREADRLLGPVVAWIARRLS